MDNNKNVLRLVALIIGIDLNNIVNLKYKKKNELFEIEIENKISKIEIIKLIIFIFSHYCSDPGINRLSLAEYTKASRESVPKNFRLIRENIKYLNNISIKYFNNNKNIVKEKLFERIELKHGKIIYSINNFFKSKLSPKSKDYKFVELPSDFLMDYNYRTQYQNCIKIFLILFYAYDIFSFNLLNNKAKEKQLKENVNEIYSYNKHYKPFSDRFYDNIISSLKNANYYVNDYNK